MGAGLPRDLRHVSATVRAAATPISGRTRSRARSLNNAATPLGIKAMEELQTLNPDKDSASNDMVTLMAVITAGVQLIPASMIGVLAAAGSVNPDSHHRPDADRHVHRLHRRHRGGASAAALLSAPQPAPSAAASAAAPTPAAGSDDAEVSR